MFAVTEVTTFWDGLVLQGFLFCAAGLGSCFALLYRVGNQMARGTYNTSYTYRVLISMVLGLMSGTIMGSLLPISAEVQGVATLARPTLALIGGFSATLVYKVLNRIVETIEAMFDGDPTKQADDARQRSDAQIGSLTSSVALKLSTISAGAAANGQAPDLTLAEVKGSIDELVRKLVDGELEPSG